MCRALYYFPPLSTPSNSRFQSSDQWPSNFLSHASSLDLCVIIVIVILFHLQTSVRLCTITIILHYFFSVRLRHHLYSYCHRLWTHSFCSPFCPLLPFNAFCLDFLTRHVYSLFTPQRIPKQSIPLSSYWTVMDLQYPSLVVSPNWILITNRIMIHAKRSALLLIFFIQGEVF